MPFLMKYIDDVIVVDHVLGDGVSEESITKLVLVSLPSYVLKIQFSTRMDDITKVDMISRIVQENLSQNFVG